MRIVKCEDGVRFFIDYENGFEKINKFIKENQLSFLWEKTKAYCDCGTAFSYQYLFIIFKLKDAGLLPDDFKMKCCYCYHEN